MMMPMPELRRCSAGARLLRAALGPSMCLCLLLMAAVPWAGVAAIGASGAHFDNTTSESLLILSTRAWVLKLSKDTGSFRSVAAVGASGQPGEVFSSTGPGWSLADPTPSRGRCPAPLAERRDCGYSGINKTLCLLPSNPKADGGPCCWVPSANFSRHPVGPQCYKVEKDTGTVCACKHDGQFSYSWSASESTLTLSWGLTPGSSAATVEVAIVATSNRFFDAVFTLLRPSTRFGSGVYTTLDWPGSLVFDPSRVSGVWFPMLPGIMLTKQWFTSQAAVGTGQTVPYPGSGTFAESVHFNLTAPGGGFATASISTISGPDVTIPHFLGFVPRQDGSGMMEYKHQTLTNVSANCDPTNGAVDGRVPCALGDKGVVRTRFSFGAAASQDLTLYGVSNGHLAATPAALNAAAVVSTPGLTPVQGAGPLPSLATKMPLPKLQQLGRAVFYKLGSGQVPQQSRNFSNYIPVIIRNLPVPGLIHFCDFEPVGFDHW